MSNNNPSDITSSVNDIIKNGRKAKIINSKEIKPDYHTVGQIYARGRKMFRCFTAKWPRASFKSLRHFDEVKSPISDFNDDFIVGIFTPLGPISYHFKLEYLEEFSHIPFSDNAPFYDGYTEEDMNDRWDYLTDAFIAGSTDDEILEEILNNSNLHESQKAIRKTI